MRKCLNQIAFLLGAGGDDCLMAAGRVAPCFASGAPEAQRVGEKEYQLIE
jgi:hypothetical protein